MATEWLAIVGTVTGGFIGLAGAVVADARRERSERNRDRQLDRWRTYTDFAEALDAGHAALRDVARAGAPEPDQYVATNQALHEAGVYRVRERLLMSGAAELVKIGETAFLGLVEIRNAVRSGAALASPEYHNAYHPFAEALWAFRGAVRTELGEEPLSPDALGRPSWSEREVCPQCGVPAS